MASNPARVQGMISPQEGRGGARWSCNRAGGGFSYSTDAAGSWSKMALSGRLNLIEISDQWKKMKHNKWNFKGYPPWNFMYKRVVMHLATLCHQWETKPEKIPAATVFAFVSFCQGALTLSVSSILVVAGTFRCSEAKRKNKQKTECALEASCRASISQAYKKFGTQLNKHSVMLTLNRLHQFVAVMFRSMSIYIYIFIYMFYFSAVLRRYAVHLFAEKALILCCYSLLHIFHIFSRGLICSETRYFYWLNNVTLVFYV